MNKDKSIYIVGIGGIGTSGLAGLLNGNGFVVAGSNLEESEATKMLTSTGIRIDIGHKAENISEEVGMLVYSNAIPTDNPERKKAEELGIKQVSYPQALGEFSDKFRLVAVTGTNGKTTTSAMIAEALTNIGADPSALIGSFVNSWKSNSKIGHSDLLIIEADEYKRAFLNYHPEIAVITNIAEDHLDYYKDLSDIRDAYYSFLLNVKEGGKVIYNHDDKNTLSLVEDLMESRPDISYIGFGSDTDYELDQISTLKLHSPGIHNRMNALACYVVLANLGYDQTEVLKVMNQFSGTWRRYQYLGKYKGAEVISDYAHHPDGLRVLLETAQNEHPDDKVLFVFQPHQHNRTKTLFEDFISVLSDSKLDHHLICEIFDVAGREADNDQDISSKDLVDKLKQSGLSVEYVRDLAQTKEIIKNTASDYQVIYIVGAGDIYLVGEELIKNN